MEIASYIKEYLLKQDYLDVSGLGTFFLSRDPFIVDSPQQKIKPSSKTLIFRENKNIKGENFLHFIARRRNISLEESGNFIDQFILSIHNGLLNHKWVEIEDFGRFLRDDSNHLSFLSHPANYSVKSFGLGELNLPPLEKKQEERREEKDTKTEPVFSNYVPFGTSLTGDAKPVPSINEYYSKVNTDEESKGLESKGLEAKGIEKGVEAKGIEAIEDKLPTAEDIYRAYSFNKINQPSSEESAKEIINTSISEEMDQKSEIKKDTSENSFNYVYPTLNNSFSETEVPEPEKDKPLIQDPLGYNDSKIFWGSNTKVSENNPFDTEEKTPSEFSDNKNLQNLNTYEDAYNANLEELEKKDRNLNWVWYLIILIFLAILTGIGYYLKPDFFKNAETYMANLIASTNPKSSISPLDSTQKKTPKIDSTLSGPISKTDSSTNVTKEDTLTDHKAIETVSKNKEESKMPSDSLTEVENTDAYLLIIYNPHLKNRAIKISKKLKEKNLENFVVHYKYDPLWNYMVCLSEFKDRTSAEKALNDLKQNPAFTSTIKSLGLSDPSIFKNNYKKNP